MRGFTFISSSLCFFFSSLVFLSTLSTSSDILASNQSLSINQSLISPNGIFKAGFVNPSNDSKYYFGVWCNNIDVQTVFWVANRDAPLENSDGVLKIGNTGNLEILNRLSSENPIWSSNQTTASTTPKNPVLQILDSGNLILRESSDTSNTSNQNPLWQSFDHPTDTIIPGMKLEYNFDTKTKKSITSWNSDSNPSSGHYSLELEYHDGLPEIYLYGKNRQKIYRNDPWSGIRFSGVSQSDGEEEEYTNLFYYQDSHRVYYTFTVGKNDSLLPRLTVTANGELRRVKWENKSGGAWVLLGYAPIDQCDNYKECGPNSVCDMNASPVCECVKGFTPKNPTAWDLRDGSEGCVRKTRLDCGSDGFWKVEGVKLPETTEVNVNRSMSLSECEVKCKANCECTAYGNVDIRNGGSGCVMLGGDLLDMRSYTGVEQDLYVRLADSDLDLDKQYTNCSNSFSCGNVSNLGFPFWGYNRADYCGLPDFQLDCENNVTKLIVNSVTYRILDFNFNQQTLTVARDDYWNTICPTQMKNNSFDGASFNYHSELLDLALLYNCINTFNPSGLFESTSCQNGDTQVVYYGNEYSSANLGGVCDVVIMPIFETYSSELFLNQISLQNAIDNGFELQWSDVHNDDCQSCVHKLGGKCGYSESKFTCFCQNGPCSLATSSKGGTLIIAIGASAGVVAIVITISIVIVCNRQRFFKSRQMKFPKTRGRINDHKIETIIETYGTLAPRRYTYLEVKRMTKSFTTKIGEGGYGIVYKAIMPDARIVAVKVISETKGNGEEFINEVASISRTSHINIVSLLGFCYEKNKRALIYEFMPNGSLDKFIFKPNSSTAICSLEWLKMYQIAIGIARGLEYLHRGCNTRILHLDIKPQNILLDEEFCPKISDFGLAKICQKKESIVSILGTRGTIGYIAPEVFSRTYGGVSYKSDVYSYGMLVLEMIGARKNYESGGSHSSEMYFPDWIYKELEHSNDVVTGNVSMNEEEKEVVRKMTLVSLWCIQTNPTDRPSMNKVVEMLEGGIESLPFPPKPYLRSPPRAGVEFSDETYSSSMLDPNLRITQTQ